jgi:hypothetical protein
MLRAEIPGRFPTHPRDPVRHMLSVFFLLAAKQRGLDTPSLNAKSLSRALFSTPCTLSLSFLSLSLAQSLARSLAFSLRFLARSLSRSLALSLSRSLALSLSRSRSRALSAALPLARSLARSLSLSLFLSRERALSLSLSLSLYKKDARTRTHAPHDLNPKP